MSDDFEMIADTGELTIYPTNETAGNPIKLSPYMDRVNSDWVINDSGKYTYSPDSVVITRPLLRVNLAVDVLYYIDGDINYQNVLSAQLKDGLVINGPDGQTVDLTPYTLRENIDIGLNPQTIDLEGRDMYIRSEHMFRITVTFAPSQLTVLGRRIETDE